MRYDLTKYDEAFRLIQNYEQVPSALRQVLVFVGLEIDFTDNNNKEMVQALFGEIGNVHAALEVIKRIGAMEALPPAADFYKPESEEPEVELTELEEAETDTQEALDKLIVALSEHGLDIDDDIFGASLPTEDFLALASLKLTYHSAIVNENCAREDEEQAAKEAKIGYVLTDEATERLKTYHRDAGNGHTACGLTSSGVAIAWTSEPPNCAECLAKEATAGAD
jgi:hypothetical protein